MSRRLFALALICAVAMGVSGCLASALLAAAGTGGAVAGTAAIGTSIGAATTTVAATSAAVTTATVATTTAAVTTAGTTATTIVATATATASTTATGAAAAVGTVAGAVPATAGAVPATGSTVGAAGSALSTALAITATTLYVPGEVIVAGLSAAQLAQVQALGFGIAEAQRLGNLGLAVLRLRPPAGMSVDDALTLLQKTDALSRYERNPVYRLAGLASACKGLRCYGQELVRWPELCSAAPRIGLLDGAVDRGHPALRQTRLEVMRLASTAPSAPEQEHATALAALLAGASKSAFPGLLPQAALLAADVFAADSEGAPYTDAVKLAQGFDWLLGQRLDVINVSVAGPPSSLLHDAIRRIVQSGIGVVAAVGNLGPQSPPQYPAAYPEVLGVTAVDRRLQIYANANRGAHVSIAAPGVGIWAASAGGSGAFRDGTSYAAPFVTAAFAVQQRQRPELAPYGVAELLRSRARRLGAADAAVFGAGLLQAPQCVRE